MQRYHTKLSPIIYRILIKLLKKINKQIKMSFIFLKLRIPNILKLIFNHMEYLEITSFKIISIVVIFSFQMRAAEHTHMKKNK